MRLEALMPGQVEAPLATVLPFRGSRVALGAKVIPLEKALELWRKRNVVDTATFDALVDELKGQAGRLVGVWNTRFSQAVYDELLDAIRDEKTLRDTLPGLQQLLDSFGGEGVRIFSGEKWSAAYADLVFRNATAAAFAGGRYSLMFSPEGIAESPYWLYNAIDDFRTRPAHRALDGKVFRKDDATARHLLPPSSHNCRCGVVSLSEADLKAGKYSIARGDAFASPEEGFDADRVQSLVPDALRRAA